LAVVVTCHGPYLKWLEGCLDSIDWQTVSAGEKVVVLDGCKAPEWLVARCEWRIVEGEWGGPGPARNVGMAATRAPWIVWFDADNQMQPQYLEAQAAAVASAGAQVAIIYPDIEYCDEELRHQSIWRMPEWDYWRLRRGNCIDTSAAWRREAVVDAGGWRECRVLDDWMLALEVTRRGWVCQRLDGPAVVMRHHAQQRSMRRWGQNEGWQGQVWSVGILTLMSGRGDLLERWAGWLETAELPAETCMYIVDNSRDREFSVELNRVTNEMRARRVAQGLGAGSMLRTVVSKTPEARADDAELARHQHVAALYNDAFARVAEDLILTFEDDTIPREPDALTRLLDGLDIDCAIGAIGGAYETRQHAGVVCAARSRERWTDCPVASELGDEAQEVGYIGGGFSLYPRWALREAIPVRARRTEAGDLRGWDAWVCESMRQAGFRVVLHEGVRCDHLQSRGSA
jgi:hypothetical protein